MNQKLMLCIKKFLENHDSFYKKRQRKDYFERYLKYM